MLYIQLLKLSAQSAVHLSILELHHIAHDIDRPSPESANEFIHSLAGSQVLIFTDGSVINGPVASGACAAVLFPVSDTEDIQIFTNAVGNKVSSFDCEVAAIQLGINTAIDYFCSCESRQTTEK